MVDNLSFYPAIRVANLTVVYNTHTALMGISGAIKSGIMMAIVGPNGAGKTTLLKAMIGLVRPVAGVVTFFGDDSHQKAQKYVAYVPQRKSVDWTFPATVFDVVLMGRFGRIGWIKRPKKEDYDAVYEALDCVGMSVHAHRSIGQLSGGQQQRVFFARALVQNAEIYLLDEPFTGIDLATEHILVSLLRKLRDLGKTIVVVHHDLQTLRKYFDWMWLLNTRSIVQGPVEDVLYESHIVAAYGHKMAAEIPYIKEI